MRCLYCNERLFQFGKYTCGYLLGFETKFFAQFRGIESVLEIGRAHV